MFKIEDSGLSNVWTHATNIIADYGEGIYIYDTKGVEYMDFTSGIGVTNTGHCHPKVVSAIKKQSEALIFGQMNIVVHNPILELVNQLKKIVPKGLDKFFFANSGAEAVEAAVKLAKHATGRTNVVVFQGSFHGRTHLTMSMTTSKTVYRTQYQPLVSGIFVTPYPYSFYYGWDDDETSRFAIKELERLLKSQTAPNETACIIIEPVLGEGGYVVPPKGFIKTLREICDEHGILLIADEIQSGFGRTGKYFAIEHEGVSPDIMVIAKGLASGMPLSGIAYRHDLEKNWLKGSHGGTYGGNPVCCAAAVATIKVLEDEKLVDNAALRGKQLKDGLNKLKQQDSRIGDVRGVGLMIATEFVKNNEPDPDTAKAVITEAASRNLLLLGCGTFGNVVRWIPPLIVNEEQINKALKIFKDSLANI